MGRDRLMYLTIEKNIVGTISKSKVKIPFCHLLPIINVPIYLALQ
jgi:hypothetical protein